MKRALSVACLTLLLAAGCEKPGGEAKPEAPAEGAARVAEAVKPAEGAAAEAVKPAGDRPGLIGCADCRVVVCTRDNALDGLRFDSSKLDLSGATATGARLRIETGAGDAITVPVAPNTLQKDDLTIPDPLKGLPGPDDAGWRTPKAELIVDYTTSKGETGTVPMAVGSVEVKGCP
ncbi:MAG: hypothetical protein R3F65_21725 [bacterium]